MKRIGSLFTLVITLTPLLAGLPVRADETAATATPAADSADLEAVTEIPDEAKLEPKKVNPSIGKTSKNISRADGFIAKADWEFDGFVAGGQDQAVRSMFYLNDLIYLNIGGEQGVEPGSRIVIYKRGNRVRDPQTGKFIGFEVRRAAVTRATDQVDNDTCSVRILNTYEAVEIGDLVRRE